MNRRSVFVFAAIAMWMLACRADSKNDALAVQHTVLRYAQLLTVGYAEMNMTQLQAVATEEQALKAYRHMSALGESKIRMESHLEDIEFTDIHLSNKIRARVTTREKWNYTHIGTDPKMPSQRVVEGLVYNLTYELVRRDGKWLVSSVSILGGDRTSAPATTDNTTLKGPDFKCQGANAI